MEQEDEGPELLDKLNLEWTKVAGTQPVTKQFI